MHKYDISFNLNKFLKEIQLKKQYIKKLKNKVSLLSDVKEKDYKKLGLFLQDSTNSFLNDDHLIMYIIDITFSRSNTLLHVTDCLGNSKLFCSAGLVKYKGKSKRARFAVFRELYRILLAKFRLIKHKPFALHLKNVGSNKSWIIKKLKEKFFIKVVKSFNAYPYNGCRKRKVRRKKFKKRRNG